MLLDEPHSVSICRLKSNLSCSQITLIIFQTLFLIKPLNNYRNVTWVLATVSAVIFYFLKTCRLVLTKRNLAI